MDTQRHGFRLEWSSQPLFFITAKYALGKETMKKLVWIRRAHKWLALIAGVQVTVCSLSGVYMTVVDLSVIHGDHLVKPVPEPRFDHAKIQPISPSLLSEYAPVHSIKLTSYFGAPIYEVKINRKERVIVDALTGKLKVDLSEQQVRANVAEVYAGKAAIKSVEKLVQYPAEIGGKKLPVWRVEFDDLLSSTLYFHHASGRLVSKRSDLWRIFDVFWVLHIMDYAGSRGFTGYLFRFFSISSLLLAIFGTWLLIYRSPWKSAA